MVHRCVVQCVECVCVCGGGLLTRVLTETMLWKKPIAPQKQYLETLPLAGASQNFSTGGCSIPVRASSSPTQVPKSMWPSLASTVLIWAVPSNWLLE